MSRQTFKIAYRFIRSQTVDISPERYADAGRELIALGADENMVWPALMCLQARDFEVGNADSYIDDGQ